MDRLKFFLILFVVFSAHYLFAELPGAGSIKIDWIDMEATVVGYGAVIPGESGNMIEWQFDATRTASEDLLMKFIHSVEQLQVDAYNSAHDILMNDYDKNKEIYTYCRDFKPGYISYGEESVTITKILPFYGVNGFVPKLIQAGRDTENFKRYEEYAFTAPFTGLVIDARGLGRSPAIAPRIFDEEHNIVYSVDLIERESFNRWGTVQYLNDPHIEITGRVGKNPLRIVAIPDWRLIQTDIAISTADARILLQHDVTRINLKEGRVVIIIDSF
jgi:hypothetical protein